MWLKICIYISKMKVNYEKIVPQPNYKLLYGILWSKWNNLDVQCTCIPIVWTISWYVYCVWLVYCLIKIDVTWKAIVLVFIMKSMKKYFPMKIWPSFIGFLLHKYKMKCRVLKEKISEQVLLNELRKILLMQNTVYFLIVLETNIENTFIKT